MAAQEFLCCAAGLDTRAVFLETAMEKLLTTGELAQAARQTANGIRVTLARKGTWHGIRPVKLGQGRSARLLWPADEVQALLSRRAGEG